MSELNLADNYLEEIGKAGESKSDYAYTPDDEPSHWKLQIQDAHHVGGAVAALGPGGFRGKKVQIPTEALAAVKRKVLAAWHKFHPDAKAEDVPEHLKVSKGEDMTQDELQGQLSEMTKQLEETNKRLATAEMVNKLSAGERVVYDALPVEKKEEYLKADVAKRNEMIPLSAEDRKVYDTLPVEKRGEYLTADATKRKELKKAGKKKAKPTDNNEESESESESEEMDEDDETSKAVKKSADALRTEFEKKLDDVKKDAVARITKAEATAEVEKTLRRKSEFSKKAETDLGYYPGTATENGELLRALSDAVASKALTEDQLKGIEKLFTAGNEALKQLTIGKGSDALTGGGGNAWDQIEKKAQVLHAEVSKSDKRFTMAKAVQRVMKEHPELYTQYTEEQRLAAKQ